MYPVIKRTDTERLRRITYTQEDGQVLDICEIKKSGRVVVHTERPGQVPGVVTFGDIDQVWYLLESLYNWVPMPPSVTKDEMHYADHGVAGGFPHRASDCAGTYFEPVKMVSERPKVTMTPLPKEQGVYSGWPLFEDDPEEIMLEAEILRRQAWEDEAEAAGYPGPGGF